MTSFRGQANWAKMMSSGGQATSPGMPPNQAEELTYLSVNIAKPTCLGRHNTNRTVPIVGLPFLPFGWLAVSLII